MRRRAARLSHGVRTAFHSRGWRIRHPPATAAAADADDDDDHLRENKGQKQDFFNRPPYVSVAVGPRDRQALLPTPTGVLPVHCVAGGACNTEIDQMAASF